MPNRYDEPFAEWEEDEARLRGLYAASRRDGWTWQAVGAGVGVVGAGVAPCVGALLSAVAWARGSQADGLSLDGAGSVLLLSAIPLLLLGGHCLDLLETSVSTSRRVRRVVRSNRSRHKPAADAKTASRAAGC